MNVEIVDTLPADARMDCHIPPFALQTTQGVLRIEPTLTRHANVLVTGRDFLPIQGDRVVLHVHTPRLYVEKRRVLQLENGALSARIGEVREIDGEALLIGGHPNYYHWLIDHLPRLLMALRVMPKERFPKILLNRSLTAVQRDTLKQLDISDWEEISEGESVRCEALWIPSLLSRTTVAHPAVPQLLRNAFLPDHADLPGGSRRVLFSRHDSSSRRLINERALETALHGFETHVPGEMSFYEQVALCAQTRVLVAAHGAALANCVFLPRGARVVELYSPHHKVTSMMLLARVSDVEHVFVPARNVTFGELDGNPLLGDWEANVELTVTAASCAPSAHSRSPSRLSAIRR